MFQLASAGRLQGIWFWAALYAFVVCTYSLVFQIRTRYWANTKGKLTSLDINTFGAREWSLSDQEYVGQALYAYTVNGIHYDGTRISPWLFVASHNAKIILHKQLSKIQQYPDGKVKVFYNHKNPRKSYLILPGKIGITVTLVLSILPAILFYVKYSM